MGDSGSIVSSILSSLGWDEGLAIPIANAENKLLLKQLETAQQELRTLDVAVTTSDEKINAIINHMKNVRQEKTHSQGLIGALERQEQSEDHIVKVADREIGRIQQEIQRLVRDISETKQKKNVFENLVFKQTTELEDYKSQMNWDQQALEAWLEEGERKTEDQMAIEKYARQDEGKIRELSLQLERLTEQTNVKRRRLDEAVIDTQTTQIELDKIAEEFRNAHTERQELITRWENTINQMQRRDQDIDQLNVALAKNNQERREKEDVIREKLEFLNSQVDNNKEQEKRITMAERMAARIRQELQEHETHRAEFQSELEALKRTVDRTNADLEAARSKVTHLKKDIQLKTNNLATVKQARADLEMKLKAVTDSKLNAEGYAGEMEKLMQEEEVKQASLENELKQLRDTEFKKSQELHAAQMQLKDAEALIAGNRAALKNILTKVTRLDHDVLKQQELLYNQDFAVQQLERRINKMHGDHSNEEKVVLEARIKELNAELDTETGTNVTLQSQLKRLQDDIRRVKRDMEKTLLERDALTVKREELTLHNDNSERERKVAQKSKQSILVDMNMMKLEIKKLRELLYQKADKVMSLEKRRLQLDTAIKERRQEIAIHKTMLQEQLRTVEGERQQVSIELKAREAKIDKLQKRFEILMVRMAPPEGEEERSQAYYVIKAAQDKEELQREGDELDAKIRKAERELQALENTLHVMDSCNENYRKSHITKVTDSSDEVVEKEQLLEQSRAVTDKFKVKRRQLRELQEEVETMGQTVESLTKDVIMFSEQHQGLRNEINSKERENQEINDKITRASDNLSRYKKVARASLGATFSGYDEDVKTREQSEINSELAREMVKSIELRHKQLLKEVYAYMQQSDIPIPSGSNVGAGMTTPVGSGVSTPHSGMSSRRSSGGPPHPLMSAASAVKQPSSVRSSLASGDSSRASTVTKKSISQVMIGADAALPRSPIIAGSPAQSVRSSKSGNSVTSSKSGR